MNQNLDRLRAVRSKNEAKILSLQSKNEELDRVITELENTEIIGLVRSVSMTPEQLAELIRASADSVILPRKEDADHA